MKNQLLTAAACAMFFLLLIFSRADAQLPYAGSFKTSSQKGLVVSGIAKLTAATGQDPEGQGYLQLTDTGLNRVGYMYAEDSFPSNYGLTATFEFFIYKTGANSFNQADGICFFLFDASVATFRPGAFGGSLGYAQKNSIPGMSKGYIGIGIDEFGNFSNPLDGGKNGGPGQFRGSVTVRGPGNGLASTDYVYQKHVVTNSAPYNINFQGFTQRYPDATSPNYRRVQFILTPGSSLGAAGYTVKVIMYRGGTTVTAVDIIDNLDYPFIAPAQLQYGMAASTGSNVDFHEIRNMDIRATNISALVTPTANADNVVTCTGQPAIFDIVSNDASRNAGGSINKETIDLDPATAGIQTSFTDAGKGTYSIDANKNIMFMPTNNFSGTSTINYNVKDSYGFTSPNGTINVTLSATEAPGLAITNPATVCAPTVVDITSAAYRSQTTSGATFDYFATLNNAYNNVAPLGNAAKTINSSGVYYIKTSANGCSTVKPITVSINQTPSAAVAGPNQTVCSSTGSTASISTAGTIPDVGTGTWTQVSGPATTTSIVNPNSAITAINGLEKGTYFFRWTVANGACTSSSSDVRIINNVAPASNAGANQNLANATTATLAATTANVGTGAWSQISGPAATITSVSNPSTTVTGLTVGSTYVFAWTVTSSPCAAASSQVTVTSTSVMIADAGEDQSLSSVQNISLLGNAPATGQTGLWTIVSSPVGSSPSFANASSRTTSVNGINRPGDYTFKWTITNGQASTEDLVKITVLSILPIDLSSFSVKMQDGTAMLNWKTPLTNTNKRFIVQRSADGINFHNLAEVNEFKNIAGANEYAYPDKLNGSEGSKLYYRLRQVNQAGIVDYSEILVLKLEGLISAQFWPNPFSAKVSMKLNFLKAGVAQVRLLDNNGKLIRDYQEKVIAGNNFLNIDGLNSLAPGVYQVLISKDGITTTNKVVKQ